jgi:glycine hydroxymethyltransferase
MNVVAAKAVCFQQAGKPAFCKIQRQTISNARGLAKELATRGYRIVSDGTDNHIVLIDLRSKGLTGENAENQLEAVGLIVNRNPIPNDRQRPHNASGLRLGTPAITARGMKEAEVKQIATWIDTVLDNQGRQQVLDKVAHEIATVCKRFPVFRTGTRSS